MDAVAFSSLRTLVVLVFVRHVYWENIRNARSRRSWVSMNKFDVAQKFGFMLVCEYLIASYLFGHEHNWKKMVYFIACAIKDVSVLLL